MSDDSIDGRESILLGVGVGGQIRSTFLACPWCNDTWTHIDVVDVLSASGSSFEITASGEDETSRTTARALPNARSGGRRHSVVLHIDCEMCPGGEISFLQHKGQTQVELSPVPDHE